MIIVLVPGNDCTKIGNRNEVEDSHCTRWDGLFIIPQLTKIDTE